MDVMILTNETWLICGGRDFSDENMFATVMWHLVQTRGCPRKIVHGAASGADTMAGEWGKRHAIEVVAMPADWERLGKAAGHIRNEDMLFQHKPKVVIAFPGGRGTADMVARAKKRGNAIDLVEVVPKSSPDAPDAQWSKVR